MRSIVLLLTIVVTAVSSSKSRYSTTHQAWNLPVPQSQSQEHEHQSIATFVSKLPRGGYDYYDGDDRRSQGEDGRPEQQYNDDYYGGNERYEEDRGYDNRDRAPSHREGGGRGFSMPNIIKTGNRKIGIPLLGVGAALTIFGVSLFFNKMLMRLGNLFFVAGVPMTLGPGRTVGYFLQPKKARATACLALGIFLVFVGRPVLGIILEVFGLLNLFGNMFPLALAVLKTMPVIGPMLRGDGQRSQNKRNDDRYDDRYDDGNDQDSYFDDRSYYEDPRDQQQDDYNQRYY